MNFEEEAATVYGVSRSLSTVNIISHHFSFVKPLLQVLRQLEIVYTLIAYQEFESLSLRQQKPGEFHLVFLLFLPIASRQALCMATFGCEYMSKVTPTLL